jgi:protein phosphatase 1 regulatory subunit 11
MAEMTQPSISTTSITTESPPSQPVPVVLRLQKPKTDKKVQWMEGVVDNEFLGRKSSKCKPSIRPINTHYIIPRLLYIH